MPKGVLREAGGHAVGLELSIQSLFGIKGPGDVMFCASDIGWVVGHSYILYAPLLVGATTVLFEGKPVGTPDAGTFWRIIERHRVNTLFTAPTAMRAIRKDDPNDRFFKEVGQRGGLKTLRALFLAGERSEPSIVRTYQDLLTQYAAPGSLVIDNWWSSESGSPISGLALNSHAALHVKKGSNQPLAIRPGSAGLPMPGFDVRIVDDEGNEVPRGTMGNIVMAAPLAPTAFTNLFQDDERFYKGYLKRFNGRWVDTGDAGLIDEDGYVHIMSRSDDIINVAAHRFSTGMYHPSHIHPLFISNKHRPNRTSHPLPPLHQRSKRSRHPRPTKGPPPLRLHHTPHHHLQRPPPCTSAPQTLRRSQHPRPRANRRDRLPGRNDPGPGDDPEDAEREDAATGVAGVGGEWRGGTV